VEGEDELKLNWAARKIPSEAIGDTGFAVFFSRRERLDRVLIFLPGFSHPSLDRSQTFDRLFLIPHDGMFGKAFAKDSGSPLFSAAR
jgi:hypothetical protein